MAFTYKGKIGNGVIEVEHNEFKKLWSVASFLNEIPSKCSACGSDDIAPMYKTPKDYEYFGVRCRSCGAEQTFHQKREGGFFIKDDDKFEKYNGGGVSDEQVNQAFNNPQTPQPPSNDPKNFQDDLIY